MYLFMHYLYVCFYFGVQNSEIKNIFYLFYYYITIYHVSRKLTVGVRATLDMSRLVVTFPSPNSNSIIEIAARGVILLSKVVAIRRFVSGMCFLYYIIYISLLFFYFSYNIFN